MRLEVRERQEYSQSERLCPTLDKSSGGKAVKVGLHRKLTRLCVSAESVIRLNAADDVLS